MHPFGVVEPSGEFTFKVETNSFYFNIILKASNVKQRKKVESAIRLNKSSTFFSSPKNNYTPQPEKNIDFSNVKRSGNKFRQPLTDSSSIAEPELQNELINSIKEETILHKLMKAISKFRK